MEEYMWTCNCGEENPISADFCQSCGSKKLSAQLIDLREGGQKNGEGRGPVHVGSQTVETSSESIKGIRANDKANSVRLYAILSLVAAIIMVCFAWKNYANEDNWKTITIMPSLLQFETSTHAITEIYEMPIFYIAICFLILFFLMTISYCRGIRCEIEVTNSCVEGVHRTGEKVRLPINQIQAVTVNDRNASVYIHMASDIYKFDFIENYMDIYNFLVSEPKEKQKSEAEKFKISAEVSAGVSIEELKKYKALLDVGIISQEEFDEKKREYLEQ